MLAAAARIDEVGDLLAELSAYGPSRARCSPAPLVYQALLASEAPAAGARPCRPAGW